MAAILLIESDANVRELAAIFLREAGHSVSFADNGMAALDSLMRERPQVVITEILLKKLDGLALCRRIRCAADPDGRAPELRGVRIIVMSVLAATERAHEAGADLFLKKPLVQRRLVDAVSSVLATREERS
jgi:CheY-like chemotaxis protein